MLIRHNEHDMDKVFRQRLHSLEEEAPIHLWEGIRQKTSKKRRGMIWWWFVPTMLLLCGIGTYAFWNYQNSQKAIASVAFLSPQKTVEEPQQVVSKSLGNEESVINDHVVSKQNVHAISTNNNNDIRLGNEPGNREKSNSIINNKYTKKEKRKNPWVETQIPSLQETENTDDTVASILMSSDWSSLISEESLPVILNTDSIKTTKLNDAIQAEVENQVFDNSLPYVNLPDQNAEQRLWLGAYYLLSQPIRMQTSSTEENTFRQFNNRTDLRLSHAVGLMATYRLPWNLNLSVGAEYQRFDEKHQWTDSVLVRRRYYEFSFDTTSSGNLTTVTPTIVDTSDTDTWRVAEHHRLNRYSTINIPVLFSWNYSRNKYAIGFELGPVFKVNRVFQGEFVFADWKSMPSLDVDSWLDFPQESIVQESYGYPVTTSQAYTNWTMDLHLGIAQSYMFSNKFGASLALQTRIMMNDSRTSNQIVHRIIQPGVRLGVNYYLR